MVPREQKLKCCALRQSGKRSEELPECKTTTTNKHWRQGRRGGGMHRLILRKLFWATALWGVGGKKSYSNIATMMLISAILQLHLCIGWPLCIYCKRRYFREAKFSRIKPHVTF